MTLTLVACVDKQNVLSCDGTLAYELPEDLQHFKDYTMGKTVFAGKNTYKECYKLKGRDWVELYREDFAEVLAYAAQAPEECILAGGAPIYEAGLPYCNKLLLSIPDQTKVFYAHQKLTYFSSVFVLNFKLVSLIQKRGFTLQAWQRLA